jgi:hypothetical protein
LMATALAFTTVSSFVSSDEKQSATCTKVESQEDPRVARAPARVRLD